MAIDVVTEWCARVRLYIKIYSGLGKNISEEMVNVRFRAREVHVKICMERWDGAKEEAKII